MSPTEVFVAVPLINLGGDIGNQTFGIPPDLERRAQAAAIGVNEEGGVACRKLRIKTYRVNPLDPNEQRSRCLEIVADKPFAVIDFAGYITPVARSCFREHGLLYQGVGPLSEEEAANSYPFFYSMSASTDRAFRNLVFETAARGGFQANKGFRKIGLLLNACDPKVNDGLKQNLAEVGVRDDQVSTFTTSCTSVAPPSEIAQAVVKHRRDDVSHVLLAADPPSSQNYVKAAEGQEWKPVYMASDVGTMTNGSFAKDWSDSFDGTVGITSGRNGELNSGIFHPLLVRCQEWMKKQGVSPPETDGDSTFAFCDMFRLFAAVGTAAGPDLKRTTLLGGLPRIGLFETSVAGDAIYDRPGKVTGGDFIRAVQWRLDCRCWKVMDREMKPAH